MKLSRKLGYACCVLAQLARYHECGKLLQINELAEIEAIPANYLVQILNELRNAGLIISKRGKQGGYALSRSPNQISLYEIVLTIDRELLGSKFEIGGHSGESVTEIWESIGNDLEAVIKNYTLEALVVDECKNMYYI